MDGTRDVFEAVTEQCFDKDSPSELCIGPVNRNLSYDVLRGLDAQIDVPFSRPLSCQARDLSVIRDVVVEKEITWEIVREVTASEEKLEYKKNSLHEVTMRMCKS